MFMTNALRTGVAMLKRIPAPKYQTVDQRLGLWAESFKGRIGAFVHCPECGKTILNDNNFLQNHMLNHVNDRSKNKEKLYRFHVTNKPTFGGSAFDIAKDKRLRNRMWGIESDKL